MVVPTNALPPVIAATDSTALETTTGFRGCSSCTVLELILLGLLGCRNVPGLGDTSANRVLKRPFQPRAESWQFAKPQGSISAP